MVKSLLCFFVFDVLIMLLFFIHFSSDQVQEFHRWLNEQREIVKECSDRSGDTQIVERKLQKLKVDRLS